MADASLKPPGLRPGPPTGFGYDWLIQLVSKRRAPLVIALIAAAMTLPAMSMGLVADDYTLADQVRRDPLGGYAFESRDPVARRASILATRDSGYSPWWVDEDFHLAFMRPLASLSLALDFRLWRDATWLIVLESALMFAGVVVLAASAFRGLGLSPAAAGLGTFFYSLKPDQCLSTGWISGRNTLMAALFGLLAVHAYVQAHRPRTPPVERLCWTLGALAALACALLSAEIGVSAGAFLLSHVLTMQHGPLSRRLLRFWPFVLVVLGWYATHRLLGYGSAGSGFYIDPARAPLHFAWNLLTALPIYLGTQLTWPFASLSCLSELAFWAVLGSSLVILLCLYPPLMPLLKASRTARFFALGSTLAVVPLGATLPLDRLVYFIGFGTCGLMAMLVTQRFSPANVNMPRRGARMLYLIHGVAMPLLYIPVMFGTNSQVLGGGTVALERALPRDGQQNVVLINGPSHLPVPLQRDMRAFRGVPQVPAIDMLYAGSAAISLHRPSERVIELDVADGYLANAFERVSRDPARKPFHAGDLVELPRMRVRVLRVNSRGAPTKVRFELGYDPNQSEVRWLAWTEHGPSPYQLPLVGRTVELHGIAAL